MSTGGKVVLGVVLGGFGGLALGAWLAGKGAALVAGAVGDTVAKMNPDEKAKLKADLGKAIDEAAPPPEPVPVRVTK